MRDFKSYPEVMSALHAVVDAYDLAMNLVVSSQIWERATDTTDAAACLWLFLLCRECRDVFVDEARKRVVREYHGTLRGLPWKVIVHMPVTEVSDAS